MASISYASVDADLTTSEFFTSPGFHETFKRLRLEDPVHWTTGSAPKPFWSVTRHADCQAVLEDPHGFSSEFGGIMPLTAEEPSPAQRHALGFDGLPTFLDPPRHGQIRQPFNKHFSVPAIARLKSGVQAAVDQLVDAVLPLGGCDLVPEVLGPLPASLVCRMMGIPERDWSDVRRYCEAFMGAQDPALQVDSDKLKTQRLMQMSLFSFLESLALERRRQPSDDMTSLVANMRTADGELLSERDVAWWCFGLVVAGLETTRGALSVGLMGLIETPGQIERLRADPALYPLAAEEVVRWVTPSKQKFRIATRDHELGGKLIRKGDWVVAWLVSANRDEDIFEQPGLLDVARSPNPHLSFGAGPHSCLGRHLARLEIQLTLQAIAERMDGLRIDGEVRWLASDNSTALTSLPVTFEARQTTSLLSAESAS